MDTEIEKKVMTNANEQNKTTDNFGALHHNVQSQIREPTYICLDLSKQCPLGISLFCA
jgi:hypothetical protein